MFSSLRVGKGSLHPLGLSSGIQRTGSKLPFLTPRHSTLNYAVHLEGVLFTGHPPRVIRSYAARIAPIRSASAPLNSTPDAKPNLVAISSNAGCVVDGRTATLPSVSRNW